MNLERLREKVIERHYPEENDLQRIREKYQEISEFIEKEFNVETHFAGSAGRKTCMKGDNDIDIFVLFDEDKDKKQLENKGLEIGKTVFSEFDGEHRIEYAEHPYTKGDIDGHEVEIVPCYDTSPEDIKSSVDRTPHHSRWVENNLDDEQRKDVVILKRFLSAGGIYGSSLRVRGFSGYLCEILISHYGSFEELVKRAPEWQENQLIDTEKQHEGQLSDELMNKFSDEPLVVIDPVDPERNVSSVLSNENLSCFMYLCWQFQKNPGMNYFEDEETEYTQFQINQELKNRADFIVLEFEAPDEVEDIIYPQMRKTVGRLEKLLQKHDFRIFNHGFHVDDSTRIFFELESTLPEIKEIKGPKIFHGAEHLDQFTSKYDNTYIKEERVVAKTQRDYSEARDRLKDFLEDDLEEKGIPSHIAEKIEDYNFTEPAIDDGKWLNYLGKKLHVEDNQRGEQ